MSAATVTPFPTKVLDVSAGPFVGVAQIRADLENMSRNLARFHGEESARDMVAEAFAQQFARWAEESQRPTCARFALEIALDNAQRVAAVRENQQPPCGGSAA